MLRKKISASTGMTFIEILVVLGIIAVLAGIITPNFKTWRNNQDVIVAQREMATNLQKIHGNALSGRQIQNLAGKFYLIKLTPGSSTYTVEGIAYNTTSGSDTLFNGTSNPVMENWQMQGGVAILSMTLERPIGTVNATNPACAFVAFGLPFGQTYIDTNISAGKDTDGICDFFNSTKYNNNALLKNWENAKLTITLGKPSGSNSKTITINGVTGQIGTN